MAHQATLDALRGRVSTLGSAWQNGMAVNAAALTAAAAAVDRAVGVLAAVTAGAGLLLCADLARVRRAGRTGTSR